MNQKPYLKFGLRWLASSLGLWLASGILGEHRVSVGDSVRTIVIAGLFLALVNMALKPLLIFLSIPALIVSLGLFMLVVNGVLIMIAGWLYDGLFVKNFGAAVLAGVIVGIVNIFVSKAAKEV